MTTATQNLDLRSIKIVQIPDKHCVKRFSCGVRSIDDWVSGKAHKHDGQDRARVFCAMRQGNGVAAGFYALSFSPINSNLLFDQHADRYKDGSAPFIYIDWLAVQRPLQRNKLGTLLLMNALQRSFAVSRNVAIYGVALRSLNAQTRAKYERHGFVVREETEFPLMILPVWTLRDLFTPAQPVIRGGA